MYLFWLLDKGLERKVILQNASAQDIEKTLEQLVKSA
jgi:NADH dehydrogenase (ubiquinone) 1 alpha subcomplex subunit 2